MQVYFLTTVKKFGHCQNIFELADGIGINAGLKIGTHNEAKNFQQTEASKSQKTDFQNSALRLMPFQNLLRYLSL